MNIRMVKQVNEVCVVLSGAYDWAKKTLQDHAKDPRPYLYTREQLENAETYDPLWNAAQVREGSAACCTEATRLMLRCVFFCMPHVRFNTCVWVCVGRHPEADPVRGEDARIHAHVLG